MKQNTESEYRRPGAFAYLLARIASFFVATFVFKRRVLRNELRGKKGPFVVIANHECQLDFVNVIGLSRRRLTFVISNAFYNSIPAVYRLLKRLAFLPKQQFSGSVADLRKMKEVTDAGEGLVIYPAGLMSEDGLSTPIPRGSYKFLKWMKQDVYMARTVGSYFVMPKWTKGFRPGRTYMDVYRLFTKEELEKLSVDEIRERAEQALDFDAYAEQKGLMIRYKNGGHLRGLENVLYRCPACEKEFTVRVRGLGPRKNPKTEEIYCTECGYSLASDRFSLLHRTSEFGPAFTGASEWSRWQLDKQLETVKASPDYRLEAEVEYQLINFDRHRFEPAGQGKLSLTKEGFLLEGELRGEPLNKRVSIRTVPTLPFIPGKRLEVQDGEISYRAVFKDGREAMKWINTVKAFYEIAEEKQ